MPTSLIHMIQKSKTSNILWVELSKYTTSQHIFPSLANMTNLSNVSADDDADALLL